MSAPVSATESAPAAASAPVDTTVLVIGAGPSGLAAGGALREAGIKFEIVEKTDAVGYAWRKHYDRLHLHTAKQYSNLPHFPWPERYPLYPSRAEVVEYLEAYAARFDLRPRLDEDVVSARRAGGRWEVRTRRGGLYRTRFLVVATGYNHTPHAPAWPGQESYEGTLLHSRQYRNGAAFRGKQVLVVGIGNTGGEIAIDLHEHGATACISVRSPVNIVPRDFLGKPAQGTAILMDRLPIKVRDWIGKAVSRLAFGDISDTGLRRPPWGPATQIDRWGRIPLIDVGTIALLRSGKLKVVPDVKRFTETGVVFADGSERAFDAVVLATGFRPDVRFVEGHERVVDDRGYPRRMSAPDALPGVWFVGYANVSTGLLREIGLQAVRAAEEIAAAAAVPGAPEAAEAAR